MFRILVTYRSESGIVRHRLDEAEFSSREAASLEAANLSDWLPVRAGNALCVAVRARAVRV